MTVTRAKALAWRLGRQLLEPLTAASVVDVVRRPDPAGLLVPGDEELPVACRPRPGDNPTDDDRIRRPAERPSQSRRDDVPVVPRAALETECARLSSILDRPLELSVA